VTVRWGRWAPLTGPLFAVVFFLALLVSGNGPNSDASAASVVRYDVVHENGQYASLYMFAVSVLVVVIFGIVLAMRPRHGARSPVPVAVGPVGTVMTAVGIAVGISSTDALTDAPTAISPAAEQALNVLSNDLFVAFVIGTIMLLLGLARRSSSPTRSRTGWVGFASSSPSRLRFRPPCSLHCSGCWCGSLS